MDGHDHTQRRRRRAPRLVGAALAAAGTVAMLTAGAAGAQPLPEPPATRCQTIDFEKATVTPVASTTTVPPSTRYRLTVSGTKPYLNMTVSLQPLVYIRQPEFWGIEVIGCLPRIGLPATAPYTATFDFTGPMGTCGIEVLGASTSQQFDLAGCGQPQLNGSWVLDPASLGVPIPAGRSITATFSATQVSGNSSCNAYFADYKTGPGNTFALGTIGTTFIACDPASTLSENTYRSKLAKADHFSVAPGELRLLVAGETVLRFTPARVLDPPPPGI